MPWLALPAGDRPWDKRRAIGCWLEEHDFPPFIWADDDPRLGLSGKPWARRLPIPSLLLQPGKTIGLTPTHIGAIEKWLDNLLWGQIARK
jgi:hypothetical protein